MKQGTLICMGNFELPDKNAAANRVVNNAKLFKALGYNTVFLGAKRSEEYFDGIVRAEDFEGFHMYEQSYPFTTKQWVKEIFYIKNLEKLVEMYPDTVGIILYNTQYFTLLKVKKEFAKKSIKVLYDCTEWNSYTEGNIIKRKVKEFDSRLIEERLQKAADGIIVVSSKMEQKYKGVPILKLPPLIDTDDFIWHQPEFEPDGKYKFVYAGSPSDKERLDTVLKVFSGLPENTALMRIIGVTKEAFIKLNPGLKELAENSGVIFEGRLSHILTVKHILSSDCCIFLRENSRRNSAGFPTKFVESFTSGVNVITTDVSDVKLYADENCRIIEDLSEEAVKKAVCEIINIKKAGSLKKAFDYKSYIKETNEWFDNIKC